MEIADVVWVGITTAVSVLLATAITGFITYKVTKRQGDVQITMHRENLRQQTNETRRDRLVEARKTLLLELRESLGRVWGSYSHFVSTALTIQEATDISAGPTDAVEQQRIVHREATLEALEHISRLMPQTSDTTLTSQIETYMAMVSTAIPEPDAIQDSTWVKILNDAQTALTTARQYQLVVNKRIEELLAGDDPT